MKIKWIILTVIIISTFTYIVRPIFLSTKIAGVHQDQYWTHIIVKNFPITDKGRIEWWENNATNLKLKYKIPVINPEDGGFNIIIWNIGEGYKQELPKQDWMAPSVDTSYLICFDDMEDNNNCIEKDSLLSISRHRDSRHQDKMVTDFSIDNNTYRRYDENKEVIKIDNNEDAIYY
ncbi:DUF943 family protein [Yersinia aleksiciae]|uniref:DUF943 family protein n=1 Tax=Yersinia aleksiciae TaxID=263819 RepID=UPI0025AAFC78|nr:DUF943 family protein [Yersinia aleksiciae]MDN0122325.1 DUF943 family protein [Yersinia aleksiciae]